MSTTQTTKRKPLASLRSRDLASAHAADGGRSNLTGMTTKFDDIPPDGQYELRPTLIVGVSALINGTDSWVALPIARSLAPRDAGERCRLQN